MPIDPEVRARVARITGADLTAEPSEAERDALVAATFAAAGIDSPAAMAAPVAIYAVDLAGRVASWNSAAEDLFGWSASEILNKPIPFLPDDEIQGSIDGLALLMAGHDLEGIEYSPVHKSGRRLHVTTSATLLRDQADRPTAIVAFASDKTAQIEASEAVEAAHHKWRHLLMNISDTVTILDVNCVVKESTGEFTDVLGYDTQAWVGSSGIEMIHPDDLDRAAELWNVLIAEPGVEYREVFRTRHVDGHYELIEFTGVNLLHDPIVDGVVMTTRNVTAQQEAETLLADEAQLLELIARDGPLAETLAAVADLVEKHGDAITGLLLLSQDARSLEIGAAGSVPTELLEISRRSPLNPNPTSGAFDIRRPTIIPDLAKNAFTEELAASAAEFGITASWAVPIIENRTEELLGVIVSYFTDQREPTSHEREVGAVASHLASIAIERDRWQQTLHHQARHHQLTGLPNRSLILDNLAVAIGRAAANESTAALMFIDLDRFKVVNDSLGHAAGDKLLVRFGGRLSNLVRPGDFVGHFGADEFIVILENITDIEDVRFVANRLDVALSEPFALEEGEVFLTASVGVAISREGQENGDSLLQHADAAMFRAKELGRDRMEVFDQEMRTRAVERLRIDRDLRMAVERSELAVHYQPKIDLATGRIVGAEALVRWNHPEHGLILPDRFIDVAEDTGIIVRIGGWVLEQAVKQARSWVERVPGFDGFKVAVNLSARQVGAPGLLDQVAAVLERNGWPPNQLILELTESILIDDRDATLDVLTNLKGLGVMLAIDDFGTGFSSLNYLHRFPVDIVKIDRTFVTSIEASGEGSPVATAVMHMAHALGLTAAAAGVEKNHQLAGLRALNCDLAQGFLFAKARPPDDIERLMAAGATW